MKIELSFGFIVFVILIVSFSAFYGIFWAINNNAVSASENYLEINDRIIQVEIADNPRSWYEGLSGRDRLCATCGMLFAFPELGIKTFVMRKMKIPLDIIWISDNIVVKVDKNLPPEGANPQKKYSSFAPVNYVLEVNAGFCDKYGIGDGDKVLIK